MLFTLSTTQTAAAPATDLGFLLHKNPANVQTFELSFGAAHVFYPEATPDRCTAALLLDVDPVHLVRKGGPRRSDAFALDQYVNDRPYVASSFLSVAISQVFSSALSGKCKDRPQLVDAPMPLTARLACVPCRGGEAVVRRLFEPLGYIVETTRHPLDEKFPEWGEGRYHAVQLHATTTVRQLLTHLYVLIPVLDNDKHYFVGDDEVQKLLRFGDGWLGAHPDRVFITERYLKHRHALTREALARLADEDDPDPDATEESHAAEEEKVERPLSLNQQRHGTVVSALRSIGARTVMDLGCAHGTLTRELLREPQFDRILAMDVSMRCLQIAADKLKLDRMPPMQRRRLMLMHGSLLYRDARLADSTLAFAPPADVPENAPAARTPFDAAVVVEVIEHFDPPRLAAFERVVFEFARPRAVIVTTPNSEYNVMWETLPAGTLRHRDHRFEWTREQFRTWAERVATRFAYDVRFLPIGPEDAAVGAPTQMAVFEERHS